MSGKEKLLEWLFLTYLVLHGVCGKGPRGNTMVEFKPLEISDVVHTLRYYGLKHCEFPLNELENRYTSGLVDFNKKQIYIESELGGAAQIKTIIHEFVHAYYETQGVILTEKETDKITTLTIEKYFTRKK